MVDKNDNQELIEKFEEYILNEHNNILDEYVEFLELSREEIFMNFFHIVKDNPENKEEFRIMMEEIIGGRPSSIIGDNFYNDFIESDISDTENFRNELIYLLAAEELIYGN